MKVCFTAEQREAISWYFNPENTEGDPWPIEEPAVIKLDEDGQLYLDGAYLHTDGEWATFPQPEYRIELDLALRNVRNER